MRRYKLKLEILLEDGKIQAITTPVSDVEHLRFMLVPGKQNEPCIRADELLQVAYKLHNPDF